MSHPPKIPGSYQHTQVYHKAILQPRKPSFGLKSLMVPFLPSALPSYPGLLVIRTPRGERMLVGQVHVCSLPLPCLYTKQVARLYPPLPQGTFVLLADCLSLAVLQNPEHLDGIMHRREGAVPCRAEMQGVNFCSRDLWDTGPQGNGFSVPVGRLDTRH